MNIAWFSIFKASLGCFSYLSWYVGVLACRHLLGDQVAGGEPEDDPADEAEVGEPVRHIPEVRHVLRQALLVDHLDVSPEQTDLPEDDDGLHVVWSGASLCPLPLCDNVETEMLDVTSTHHQL